MLRPHWPRRLSQARLPLRGLSHRCPDISLPGRCRREGGRQRAAPDRGCADLPPEGSSRQDGLPEYTKDISKICLIPELRLVLLTDPVANNCQAVDGSMNETNRLLRVKVHKQHLKPHLQVVGEFPKEAKKNCIIDSVGTFDARSGLNEEEMGERPGRLLLARECVIVSPTRDERTLIAGVASMRQSAV